MTKRFVVLGCILHIACCILHAQAIPVPLTQERLYDYLDELATDGIIELNEAARPFTARARKR